MKGGHNRVSLCTLFSDESIFESTDRGTVPDPLSFLPYILFNLFLFKSPLSSRAKAITKT